MTERVTRVETERTHYVAAPNWAQPATAAAQPSNSTITNTHNYPADKGWIVGVAIVFLFAAVIVAAFANYSGAFMSQPAATAWQAVKKAEYTRDRAIANANANATAGFGNNDKSTHQEAVHKGYPPPSTNLYPPQQQAPAASPPAQSAGQQRRGYGAVEHHSGRPSNITNVPCTKDGRSGFRGQDERGRWGCVLS